MYIAAFAVSAYSSTYHRAGCKPFNPVLGETYECERPDRGFRFISEQVWASWAFRAGTWGRAGGQPAFSKEPPAECGGPTGNEGWLCQVPELGPRKLTGH